MQGCPEATHTIPQGGVTCDDGSAASTCTFIYTRYYFPVISLEIYVLAVNAFSE